ncbi:MAG: DoxX family protein [Phycisphaeraceae bacterium]
MQAILTSIGLLILRLGIGGYMLTHGLEKLAMLRAGDFEMMGDPIGIGAVPSLLLITFAELVCSLFVMMGLATRLAAVPPAIGMAVAAFVAHAADPWTMGQGYALFFAGEAEMPLSKQPAMMFLVGFLALVFTGPGRLSLDALLWPRLRTRLRGPAATQTAPARHAPMARSSASPGAAASGDSAPSDVAAVDGDTRG